MKRRLVSPALLLCLLSAGCSWVISDNRPDYAGPTAAAIWHLAGINVQTDPVVAASVAYAIGVPWNGGGRRVYAVNAADGKLLWSAATPRTALVAVAGGIVYLGNTLPNRYGAYDQQTGGLDALDARTGHPRKAPIAALFEGATYAGNATYVTAQGRIYAVDDAGSTLWSTAVPLDVLSNPIVIHRTVLAYGGHEIALGYNPLNGTFAFDRSDGTARWKDELLKPSGPFVRSVLADDGGVYVWEAISTDDPTQYLLRTLDLSNGRQRWEYKTASASHCTHPPSLLDDPPAILACIDWTGDGYSYVALDRRTGRELWQGRSAWHYDTYVPYGRYLVVADRKAQQLMDEGGTTRYDSWVTLADVRAGTEVWRTPALASANLTRPAIAGRIAVLGSSAFQYGRAYGTQDVTGFWGIELPPDPNR